jgi:hypothetical protein
MRDRTKERKGKERKATAAASGRWPGRPARHGQSAALLWCVFPSADRSGLGLAAAPPSAPTTLPGTGMQRAAPPRGHGFPPRARGGSRRTKPCNEPALPSMARRAAGRCVVRTWHRTGSRTCAGARPRENLYLGIMERAPATALGGWKRRFVLGRASHGVGWCRGDLVQFVWETGPTVVTLLDLLPNT